MGTVASSSSSSAEKVRVVVIGCGFAGFNAVVHLRKYSNIIDLVIIESKEFFTNKIGGLR
jgi:NADH dehydrogenase FAD-containing subunit